MLYSIRGQFVLTAAAPRPTGMKTDEGRVERPAAAVSAAALRFSWDTVPYSVFCHNESGLPSRRMLRKMADASFTVIDEQSCQHCAPNNRCAPLPRPSLLLLQ